MFNSNSIQPDVRPHEIAFVEASEKKRSRTRASEEELPAFLEPIIMGDDDDERSSFHSDVSEEEEVHSVCSLNSVEMYNGILYGDTPAAGMPNRGMGRHEDHDIDRVLRKHSSSYFLPDARCCFLLVLTIASLGISIFATDIARSNTEASFTTEVSFGRYGSTTERTGCDDFSNTNKKVCLALDSISSNSPGFFSIIIKVLSLNQARPGYFVQPRPRHFPRFGKHVQVDNHLHKETKGRKRWNVSTWICHHPQPRDPSWQSSKQDTRSIGCLRA